MQGVLSGAYDIGEASSANAVNNLYTAVANNNIPGFTVDAVLIGGSGVVFATTSGCGTITNVGTATVATCTEGGALGANPLGDGANACLEITRDALAKIYAQGSFYIATGACSGTATTPAGSAETKINTLDAACVTNTATPAIGAGVCATGAVATAEGPYAAISRSDPGGTEDTACGYLAEAGVLS